MDLLSGKRLKTILIGCLILLCAFGVFSRFFKITHNDFFFYDEGYYFHYNQKGVQFIAQNFPRTPGDFLKALFYCLRFSLATGKALWFFIIDSRVFYLPINTWYFPRIVAALAGLATIAVTFLFSKRFFNSTSIGIISAVTLAVFPGHVFYSRLALQESLSALLFLCGFYFYIFPKKLHWKTFLSAAFLAGAFFTNYRLIFLPVPVLFCELFISFAEKQKCDLRKYIWHLLTFLLFVFLVGNIDKAQNTIITFAWMFHQTQIAESKFDIVNLFSYPYYIFRLEGILFGLMFFGNVYFAVKKQWRKLFPFSFALLHMAIFSFAGSKGARYMCVVFPFMTLAVAALSVYLFDDWKGKSRRLAVIVFTVLMLLMLTFRSVYVMALNTDYETSIDYLKSHQKDAKILSTQPWVQNLYFANADNILQIEECPRTYQALVKRYREGFRYLILCPQAYVSWTEKKKAFSPKLVGYLHFIRASVKPLKVFPHFSKAMLERFVFEHNENLRDSVAFLSSNDDNYGALIIYDIRQCILKVEKVIALQNKR